MTPIDKSEWMYETKEGSVAFVNPTKIFFPEDGYTKGDLIQYYRETADYILPYLKDRPQSLNRHPNGIDKPGFYQKDVAGLTPSWIKTIDISHDSGKTVRYLVVTNEASLLYMVNLGCIEINPWFSRTTGLSKPDFLVIDLDPEDISFDKVVETALVVKEALDKAGSESFCKTSGATGLHIYVPIGARYEYEVAKNFTHLMCQLVNENAPLLTSIERSPGKRQKRVYLDYLQNSMGQTLAAPYSVRPRPGAPVSAPLEWKEVKKGLDPCAFTIKTMGERLKKKGDLFKGALGKGVDIKKCLRCLEKIIKF